MVIKRFIAPPEDILDNVDEDREAETDEEEDFKEPIRMKQAMEALRR